MAGTASNDVIDWHEAMQQCGDDEDFLRELLADLRTETQTQVTNIQGVIQNPQDQPYYRIMRAAHVVKGAAANLMCQKLRMAAMNLEDAARAAHEAGETAAPSNIQANVQARFGEMQQAVQGFLNFLQSIGI